MPNSFMIAIATAAARMTTFPRPPYFTPTD